MPKLFSGSNAAFRLQKFPAAACLPQCATIVSTMTQTFNRRPRRGIERLREEVRRRVETEGLRPFAARTGIPMGRVRGLLDGRAALSSTLEAAAAALGLEIDVGPPQSGSPVDAPAQTDRTDALLREILSRLPASAQPPANALEDAGAAAQPAAVEEAVEFPGTRLVAVRGLAAAAGCGAADMDEAVAGYVGFRRDWLARHALDPAQCSVIEVTGESMEPTLPQGCSILVDHSRRQPSGGRIYAIRSGDGLVVKRAGSADDGGLLMVSDHPAWPSAPWPADAAVVGEVRWMARTL